MVVAQLRKVRDTSDALDVVADTQSYNLYGTPFAPVLHPLLVKTILR